MTHVQAGESVLQSELWPWKTCHSWEQHGGYRLRGRLHNRQRPPCSRQSTPYDEPRIEVAAVGIFTSSRSAITRGLSATLKLRSHGEISIDGLPVTRVEPLKGIRAVVLEKLDQGIAFSALTSQRAGAEDFRSRSRSTAPLNRCNSVLIVAPLSAFEICGLHSTLTFPPAC